MISAPGSGTKAPELDSKKSLLEYFGVNEEANQPLLSNVSDASWRADFPTRKGRSITEIATHKHHERLRWLSAAAN